MEQKRQMISEQWVRWRNAEIVEPRRLSFASHTETMRLGPSCDLLRGFTIFVSVTSRHCRAQIRLLNVRGQCLRTTRSRLSPLAYASNRPDLVYQPPAQPSDRRLRMTFCTTIRCSLVPKPNASGLPARRVKRGEVGLDNRLNRRVKRLHDTLSPARVLQQGTGRLIFAATLYKPEQRCTTNPKSTHGAVNISKTKARR